MLTLSIPAVRVTADIEGNKRKLIEIVIHYCSKDLKWSAIYIDGR